MPALCGLLLLAAAGTVHGQVRVYPDCMHQMVPEPAALRENLLADLERRAVAALQAIQRADDRRELEEQRAPLREKLRASLGLDRLPPADGAEAVTTGVLERQGYRIEKLLIPTLTGLWAPAHLYLPAVLEGPAPAVLLAAGNWPDEGKSHPDAQAFGINLARRGLVALAYDPFGFGERADSPGDHNRTDLLMVGIPPQGIVQFELSRALDYLESRAEVDPERIGVTGADGGGWDALLLAALDDRVRAAVIIGEASDLRDRIRMREPRENVWVVPGMAHYANVHELLALVAPRPLMLVDATGPVYDYAANAYATLQAGQAVSLLEEGGDGPGHIRPAREAAYGWFARWLHPAGSGQPVREAETRVEAIGSEELLAVPPGQSVSSTTVLDSLLAELGRSVQLPAQFQLDRLATQPLPRPTQGFGINAAPVGCRSVIQTQRGVQIPMLARRPGPDGWGVHNGILVAIDDRGKEAMLDDPIIREAVDRRGWMVWIIEPRGFGELATPQAAWEFETSLLLGEDYLWRQGEDVRHVVQFARGHTGRQIVVLYARGPNASLAAAYALAVADPQPHYAVLRESLLSFGQIFQAKLAPAASPLIASDWLNEGQIPPHFFARDILAAGDLSAYLEATKAKLFVIDPLSNENGPRLLPSAARSISVEDFLSADW